jgi:fructose-1,6-bisphosphatase/inositol monophosphatase family enzyme
MDEETKHVALTVVDKIYQRVKKAVKTEFHKLGSNIGIGADGTPTKYIDKIAEDIALRYLSKIKHPVNVLSEEIGFVDNGAEYTFVLDPVDGTRNAVRGIPFYSISLGIGRSKINDVEYGVVKNIPTGDVFLAEKNKGAFLNNNQIAVPECPEKLLLSSLTLGKNIDEVTNFLAQRDIVRSLGSASLEMCMVAIGALDFYVVGREFMRVTDIAASTLIVREAGGLVKNTAGEELEMDFTLDERTSVVAACSEELIHQILSR